LETIKRELFSLADKKRANNLAWFFKTGKGEYGEGDKFLGIKTPVLKEVVKKHFKETDLRGIEKLLADPFHEARSVAVGMLVAKYERGVQKEKEGIYRFYLRHTARINNWDLVDLSAHKIVGDWLSNKKRTPLYRLAKSKILWERRMSIISTFAFVRKGDLNDAFAIAEILLKDKEDLMHKAVGWVLRECGKKNKTRLLEFIKENGEKMPRTTLRYAIERFPEGERKKILQTTK